MSDKKKRSMAGLPWIAAEEFGRTWLTKAPRWDRGDGLLHAGT